jgi:hypothetical protein
MGYGKARKTSDSDFYCQTGFTHNIINCQTLVAQEEEDITKVEELQCEVCKENSFPLDFSNQFTCIQSSRVLELKEKSIVVNLNLACNLYNKDAECVKCRLGYVLQEVHGSNQCVLGCAPEMYLQAVVYENGEAVLWNHCTQDGLAPNMEALSAPNLSDPNLEQIFIACKEDLATVVSLDYLETNHSNFNPEHHLSYS